MGSQRIGPHVTLSMKSLLKAEPLRKLARLRMAIGRAVALGVRDRVMRDRRGPDGSRMGPFKNSGGMWGGYEARSQKTGVVAKFYKSSATSAFALRHRRKDEKAFRKLMRQRNKAGKPVRVRNRDKAWAAQKSMEKRGAAKGRDLLEPTKKEVATFLSFVESFLERNILTGERKTDPSKRFKPSSKRVASRLPPG